MLAESNFRRSVFHEGVPIPLARGGDWIFPEPPAGPASPGSTPPAGLEFVPFGKEYAGLLECVLEAEDADDLLRAELALAIYLLRVNYRLTPDLFREILDFSANPQALRVMQRTFHELALEHLRSIPPPHDCPEARQDGFRTVLTQKLRRVSCLFASQGA